MALDPERRAALEQTRLRGLVRDHFGVEIPSGAVVSFPFGAAAHVGDDGWICTSEDDLAVLGGALMWAERSGVEKLHLLAGPNAGTHARRAATLDLDVDIWEVVGADCRAAAPDPLPVCPPPPVDIAGLVSKLELGGTEIVVEDGIVRGEIAGLEVARIVDGPGGPALEVGVGRFDREAGLLLHPDEGASDALDRVVGLVSPLRRPGAIPHPVNRLARSRWLRSSVVADAGLVDCDTVEPVEPIPPPRSLLVDVPTPAIGVDGDRRVLVVCTVGVDLGLVPAIADLLARHRPNEVRLVLPARDLGLVERQLTETIPVSVRCYGVTPPWDS